MRGKGIWDLAGHSADPEARKEVMEMAANCNSGHFVV